MEVKKVTNGDIYQARKPLAELLEEKWPIKISFQLAKLVNKLNVPLQTLDTARLILVNRYGTDDGRDGKRVIFPGEDTTLEVSPDYKKFIDEMNELLAQEADVIFEKVKLPSDVDGKPVQLKASTLISLEKFIEVE